LDLKNKGSRRFIWASADADKTAREAEREHATGGGKHVHGLFSFHLIEGLRGGEMDYGRISVGALEKYLETAFKDTEHKPQLSAGASIDKHEIYLTEMEEELERRIRETLGDVERALGDKPSPTHVMFAIRSLNGLKRRKLCLMDTGRHWDRIGTIIAESASPAYQWWIGNKMEVLNRVLQSTNCGRWYKLLDDILLDFDLERVCQLGEREMSFVASALEAIQSENLHPQHIGREKIVRYITMAERGDSRMVRVGTSIKGPPSGPAEG
jgi:hypothetical protein